MQFRHRRHRYRPLIALTALLALLCQQFAMAAYLCPMELQGTTLAMAVSAAALPCHAPADSDRIRCAQHCHPTTASADHAALLTVPPALQPAIAWPSELRCLANDPLSPVARDVQLRTTSPPLTIQHCSFQL